MESITLYFKEGASDKIYQASLEEKKGGWVANFAYGRRGSTLSTGTKTQQPVEYAKAKAIFDKLVKEKKAKGYTEGENGTSYSGGDGKDTGIRPQLLNPITEDEAKHLLADSDYFMQQKLDGRRLMLLKQGNTVIGINRRGLECGIPEPVRKAALNVKGDFLLDGEAVGDILYVFDLLEYRGEDLREQPYRERLAALLHLLLSIEEKAIECVITQLSAPLKRDFFDQLTSELAEGVVFKRASAPYRAGRPASGGDQLKFKFVDSASCVVGKVNGKRSVQMQVFDGGQWVSVGNVTIPTNQEIPEVGAVIECKYLYAFKGGCLFQPVYLGQREDILPEECILSQLKFKSEPQSVAA